MSNNVDDSADTGLNVVTSPSLESTASVSPGTTGRFTGVGGRVSSKEDNLINSYGQNLFNTVCVFIWCPNHKRTALRRLHNDRGIWLPSAPIRPGQGWFDSAIDLIKATLRVSDRRSGEHSYPSFSAPKLINVLRIQVPIYCEFIFRPIFFSELTYDQKNAQNCCSKEKQWFSAEHLIRYRVTELWGPEPIILAALSMKKRVHDFDIFLEMLIKDILVFCPKDSPKSLQEEMVKSAHFSEKEIFETFGEYLQHSFPSQYMTLYSFENYLTKFGYPDLGPGLQCSWKAIFQAFSFNSLDYLSFNEFLLGLCAMDKNSPHRQLRAIFLFRYYSGKYASGTYLNLNDIKVLARDLLRVRSNGQLNESAVDNEVKQILAANKCEQTKRIEEKDFVKLISEGKVRNTSALFRSTTSLLQQMRDKRVYQSLQLTEILVSSAVDAKRQRVLGSCQRCRLKKYTLAAHTVRLSRDGYIVDPQENMGQSDVLKMPQLKRRQSNECFTSSSVANIILDTIRSYAIMMGLSSAPNDSSSRRTAINWNKKKSRLQMVENITLLLSECGKIFQKEPRVLKVCSPVFVLGDIHGNLHDVMIYERSLWKMGAPSVAADFLFLGDYVDRGEYSVECVLYLLSHKLLCPEKYWFLRGNHELRDIQLTFTFKTECLNKFGEKVGQELWEAFNQVFDFMPICAIIDDSIFCAHGGIPTSSLKIEELYKMPTPLPDPENQFIDAWNMLWNDPVTNQEFRDYEKSLRESGSRPPKVPGFLPNTKRGTAYYFSEEALSNFLSANQLSHVIRAHEVIPNGYAFHVGGKCITIFSSSKYCGGLNEAAVILVSDEKIRVIKIDTS